MTPLRSSGTRTFSSAHEAHLIMSEGEWGLHVGGVVLSGNLYCGYDTLGRRACLEHFTSHHTIRHTLAPLAAPAV